MRFRLLLVLFLAMCSSKVLFAQGYTLTTSCYVTLSVQKRYRSLRSFLSEAR
jgi:hypothetical protein